MANQPPPESKRIILRRSDIHYPKPRRGEPGATDRAGLPLYGGGDMRNRRSGALSRTPRSHGWRPLCQCRGCRAGSPAELTWRAGVDVLCFGGIKPGIALSEAVVFFDCNLPEEFDYRCKQGGQLAAKMRFSSAPWAVCLQDGIWLRNAEHANLGRPPSRRETGRRAGH